MTRDEILALTLEVFDAEMAALADRAALELAGIDNPHGSRRLCGSRSGAPRLAYATVLTNCRSISA